MGGSFRDRVLYLWRSDAALEHCYRRASEVRRCRSFVRTLIGVRMKLQLLNERPFTVVVQSG